jgi:hypothetical protein
MFGCDSRRHDHQQRDQRFIDEYRLPESRSSGCTQGRNEAPSTLQR